VSREAAGMETRPTFAMAWGMRRERIARGVARKCVERGLWTEEEGEAFLAAVGVKDTAGLRPAAGSSDPARTVRSNLAKAAKGDLARTVRSNLAKAAKGEPAKTKVARTRVAQ